MFTLIFLNEFISQQGALSQHPALGYFRDETEYGEHLLKKKKSFRVLFLL